MGDEAKGGIVDAVLNSGGERRRVVEESVVDVVAQAPLGFVCPKFGPLPLAASAGSQRRSGHAPSRDAVNPLWGRPSSHQNIRAHAYNTHTQKSQRTRLFNTIYHAVT